MCIFRDLFSVNFPSHTVHVNLFKPTWLNRWRFRFPYIYFSVKISIFLKNFFQCKNRDPDPEDPHVLRPPGFGSISQRYGSRSLPWCWADWHNACKIKFKFSHKILAKIYIFKTEKNVPAASLKSLKKGVESGAGSWSVSQRTGIRGFGSAPNVTDPQHFFL